MTAKIIDFRVHQLKSTCLAQPHAKRTGQYAPGRASIDQQVAHASWLIRELEDIWRAGDGLPPGLVAEAHASIERTKKMLHSWQGARIGGTPVSTTKGAAQPNIDPGLLERMYSELGLHP
jgi:hypothetical protein